MWGLIIAMMVIVAINYRQTIKAYPQPDWWQ